MKINKFCAIMKKDKFDEIWNHKKLKKIFLNITRKDNKY